MKYEYKILGAESASISEEKLNELGQEGWILQTIYPHPDDKSVVYYFARPITN